MKDLDVRIVTLEPIRFVSFHGFGTEPEAKAHTAMLEWAREHGILEEIGKHRFFGFNNPSPAPGSPNYGYEIWLTVDLDFVPDGGVALGECPGGMYAVTRVTGVNNIEETWKRFVAWGEKSPYRLASHQWLEEHLNFIDVPLDEFTLDLYMPVKK